MLVFFALIALHEQAAPDQPEPSPTQPPTTRRSTTIRPPPKCGSGCQNYGECRYVSATNSTAECHCGPGWSGAQCQTCYGRTRLAATETTKIIHDGEGNYTSNALSKCSWLIENDQPDDKMIQLKLANFSTECGWDHLYIFDGTSALESTTIGAYCGIVKQQHTMYATSGSAFLHFYSDMAYNMSGFDIEYSLVAKADPARLPKQETDKHGNKWSKTPLPLEFGARAASSIVVVNGIIYAWGGYQFPNVDNDYDNRVWSFDGTIWTNITSLEATQTEDYIKLRYGGAMVAWSDTQLIVYGGVKYEPNYEVVEDVWQFDLTSKKWSNITPKKISARALSADYLPLPNSGHSMVKATFENGTSIIISYGGYSPTFGYLSTVQEFIIHDSTISYDPADNNNKVSVRLPFTYGERPNGSYGHVALVDPDKPWLIYYYGGFKNSALSDELTVYNAAERRFSRMVNSKMGSVNARWFHSGIIWRSKYLVYVAGNTHTDTVFSTGSLCFSNDVVIYSLKCNKWKLITIPKWYPRYGSASVLYNEKFFALGGFNGALIDDFVEIELSESLLGDYFDESDSSCGFTPEAIDECENTYTKKSYLGDDECTSCTHNNYWTPNDAYRTCSYCSGKCSSNCQRAPRSKCEDEQEKQFACKYPDPKCASCVLSGCQYYVYTNKSEKRTRSLCSIDLADPDQRNVTVAKMNSTQECASSQMSFECGTYRSCELCTQKHNCMWCGILGTCVSNEAHVTSFPFGQCHEWFQKQHCYKTTCKGHLTCRSCQNDPRCGWCDDGTGRGSGECMEGTLTESSEATCPAQNWFWVDCPQCNCSGHSQCDEDGNCLQCSNFTSGANCERCMNDYHGIALNNGTCTKCQCGRHGKSCDHTTGKCSCTTKGITGSACDQCDKDGYKGNAINSTCYYDIKTDFQYSFRMKPDIDKDVTKLNCIVVPAKPEPGIKVKVIIENVADKDSKSLQDSGNNTLSVNVTTTMPSNGTYEEHIVSDTNTTNFEHSISVKKYKFGPETNRTILIYIYDFQTPLKIKVTVTQHVPMSLLTFFLVFFACFLSLLLIAVIVWKLKTMWDVQLQRRAVMNEMRQMAARPFASVEMQLSESVNNDTDQLITPACYEIIEDKSAAVATVLMLLPRHRNGAPSIGDSAVCFGSVMINYNEKCEADFLLEGNEGDNPDEWGHGYSVPGNNHPPDSAT